MGELIKFFPPLGSRVRVSVPPCGPRGGRNGVWVGFSRGFSLFPYHNFHSTIFSTLISSISFHFICPCDGASGVVGRHPCYSRTYIIGVSSHLIHTNYFLSNFWVAANFSNKDFLYHFMIWVLTLTMQAFRILYRVNVVKFVNIVIVLMMNYYYYLAREGPIWHGNVLRGKSVLLSLRNILIHHQN